MWYAVSMVAYRYKEVIMGKPRKYPEGTAAVTVEEAARILGISCCTMESRVKDGTVHSFRIGKLRRISRKTLESIMEGKQEGNGKDRVPGQDPDL
jgi:excisionase family DNA binding protein